jgi:hypothetical protein
MSITPTGLIQYLQGKSTPKVLKNLHFRNHRPVPIRNVNYKTRTTRPARIKRSQTQKAELRWLEKILKNPFTHHGMSKQGLDIS